MTACKDQKARILVCEDDESISEAIAHNLKKQGYHCLAAQDGVEALRSIRKHSPDLMILDLMLPRMDGWKLCEQLRQEGFDLPIIICSARTSEFDKVHGLSIGADDYLVKPFSMAELIARVEANLRRARPAPPLPLEEIVAGPLTIDPQRKEVFGEGDPLGLTPKEFKVLHVLALESPRALAREELYEKVWGYGMMHGDRSVDVFVRRIRKKIESRLPGVTYLQTHYGFGYKFEMVEDTNPGGENEDPSLRSG